MTDLWFPALGTLGPGAAVTFCGFLLLWPLSLKWRDASIVDLWWGPGFAAFLWALPAPGSTRGAVVIALVTLWALRIFGMMLRRRRRTPGEDPRYAALRRAHGRRWRWQSLVHVFLLQAILQCLLVMPAAAAVLSPAGGFGLLAWLGLTLALGGLLLETLADHQLDRWRKARPEALMTSGLRRHVRHPNYAGEILFWLGIALIAVETGAAWAPAAPILLALLLGFVSGRPLLDERLSRHDDWPAYAARTPGFVPRRR